MSEIRSQATAARDELVHILAGAVLDNPGGIGTLPQHAANRLLTAGWSKPRTVNSATELKALPLGSVITWLDNDEREAAVIDWEPGDGRHTANAYWMGLESMISYPATVLFTPGDAG
ncbi:hypothetical protein [Rhodococcus erythropolis]|uniref:hypothetical protein n=1 Tax=Rhodococcus erythropolis TaxID=1833 RepID=UPI00366BB022